MIEIPVLSWLLVKISIAIKAVLAKLELWKIAIIAKAWLLHALSAGCAFFVFLSKSLFVHTLLVFAIAGWLSFTSAGSEWETWLHFALRAINPFTWLALAAAFVWEIGLWLTRHGWLKSSLPIPTLTVGITAPVLLPSPLGVGVLTYVLVLIIFWHLFSKNIPLLWDEWKATRRKEASSPRR